RNQIYALQSCKKLCTIALRYDRTTASFQFANRTVAIQANSQEIAERTRSLQVPHMPDVEQIETAVRSDQLFPSSTQLLTVMRNLLKFDDFWAHGFRTHERKYRLIARRPANFQS